MAQLQEFAEHLNIEAIADFTNLPSAILIGVGLISDKSLGILVGTVTTPHSLNTTHPLRMCQSVPAYFHATLLGLFPY